MSALHRLRTWVFQYAGESSAYVQGGSVWERTWWLFGRRPVTITRRGKRAAREHRRMLDETERY